MSSSSTSNQQIIDLNNVNQYMHKYFVPVIFILGNIGNLLSMFIFSKKSWRKNVCTFYLKFLILCNSCYINSIILATIFIHGFHISLHNSNSVLCKLYLYTSFVFISVTPTILISASIDRLLISSQNVDTRLYSSKRLAYFSLSIGTCFWIIFNIHIPIMFEVRQIIPSVFICAISSSRVYTNFIIFFSAVSNVVYWVVMIILCVLSVKNVRHIRAVPREKRNQQIRSMNKKDFQLLRCLFVQDVVYICLSMPYVTYYVYQAATRDQVRAAVDQALVSFINRFIIMIYGIYYASSFFIFVIVSRAFRHELKRLICKMVGKEVNPIREEENRPENIVGDNVEMNIVPTIVLAS